MNKYIEVKRMVVRSRPGVTLHEAIREATVMAVTEDRVVHLEFNDMSYAIDPTKVVALITNGGAK